MQIWRSVGQPLSLRKENGLNFRFKKPEGFECQETIKTKYYKSIKIFKRLIFKNYLFHRDEKSKNRLSLKRLRGFFLGLVFLFV